MSAAPAGQPPTRMWSSWSVHFPRTRTRCPSPHLHVQSSAAGYSPVRSRRGGRAPQKPEVFLSSASPTTLFQMRYFQHARSSPVTVVSTARPLRCVGCHPPCLRDETPQLCCWGPELASSLLTCMFAPRLQQQLSCETQHSTFMGSEPLVSVGSHSNRYAMVSFKELF